MNQNDLDPQSEKFDQTDREGADLPVAEAVSKANKPKNKKRVKRSRKTPEIGTNKGVETMFRNAVRSEMELLALAATKANIMISLNGFIVSALMISGAFIFSSSPEFLLPATVFILTATASIIFALLSASPERIGKIQAARAWMKDVMQRKAKLGDWRERIFHRDSRFFDKTPNVLIYEDRVKITKQQFWEMMLETMSDRKEMYQKMSDHLYWLGLMANKQFKYLNLSYTVFRWGLLLSLVAFVSVKSIPGLVAPQKNNAAEMQAVGLNMMQDVYEPSAVQQLPDGRILVAEDEAAHAFSIISVDKEGRFVEDKALDTRIVRGFKQKISDLESLARDNDGFIYALTSHSRNKQGERKSDRERLLRFKIQGSNVIGLGSYDKLTERLESDENLHKLIAARTDAEISFRDVNIEGMAFDPVKNRLLLGFRDPELNEKALVLYISNPGQMFAEGADPVFADAAVIPISGGGIRSLNYDPVLKAFLITNEVKDENGDKYSTLWRWSGNPEDEPDHVSLPNLRHMVNVEAMDSVTINGKPYLLLMSDEGDADKGVTAKYMLVDYQDL